MLARTLPLALLVGCGCNPILCPDPTATYNGTVCICPDGTPLGDRPCDERDAGSDDGGLRADAGIDAAAQSDAGDAAASDAGADAGGDAGVDVDAGPMCRGCLVAAGGEPFPELSGLPGRSHTCVVRAGEVFCFGANHLGQLGDGTREARRVPVPVELSREVVDLAIGEHTTCVVDQLGATYCWGSNVQGVAGHPASVESDPSPNVVGGIVDAAVVAVGTTHACVVDGGDVRCWGSNALGELGRSGEASHEASEASALSVFDVVEVSAGRNFSCALTSEGDVLCWGSNAAGQLGLPDDIGSMDEPTPVPGVEDAVAIASGWAHTCAVVPAGLWCWGSDRDSQIGDGGGLVGERFSSGMPEGLDAVEQIHAGAFHTLALDDRGRLWGWGYAHHGQLGVPAGSELISAPRFLDVDPQAVAVGAGAQHSCWFDARADLLCMGSNTHGQLGNGMTTDSHVPVRVVLP